jgi:steroid delta-isomerase-like uncharacterized protein
MAASARSQVATRLVQSARMVNSLDAHPATDRRIAALLNGSPGRPNSDGRKTVYPALINRCANSTTPGCSPPGGQPSPSYFRVETFSSKNLGTTLLGGLRGLRHRTTRGSSGMTDTKLEQFARDSVDAFNRSDWDAIREMTCPGYVYEETGTGRRFDGVDDTLGALKEWKEAAPDATGEVVRVVTEGDTTVMEIVWRGTQTGPLNTGAGELPASGKAFEVQASMWQTWRDGKLADERHHLDVLTMLAQLGAIPASV